MLKSSHHVRIDARRAGTDANRLVATIYCSCSEARYEGGLHVVLELWVVIRGGTKA